MMFGANSPWAKPVAKALRYAAHTLLGAAMSWVYFAIFAIAVPVAGALSIVWLGLPLLLALVLLTRGFASFERYAAVRLLDVEIAKPSMPRIIGGKIWSRLRWNIAHSSTWRGIVFLVLRMVHGIVASLVLLAMGMLSIALIVGPLVDSELRVMQFTLHGFAQTWILMPLGLVSLVITILIAYGWAYFMPPIARLLLGPSTAEDVQKLRIEKADLTARNELARELHDSVGHAMTAVVVQASAARDAFERDGAFAKQALTDIEAAAREALSDLDSVLGALRDGAPITDDNTLAEIAQLVASTRRMGANVNMNLAGDLEHLPTAISNIAYRVVKEGLTNAIKHGELKTDQIDVGVQVADKAVLVEVKNNGVSQETKAQRNNTFGWGLRGLTSRVTELGGSIESGQSANGGYLLRVSLPISPNHV